MLKTLLLCLLFLPSLLCANSNVLVGIDNLFNAEYRTLLSGKKIGLICNHTSVNSKLETTQEVLKANASTYGYTLTALFGPEHGVQGSHYAGELIDDKNGSGSIPIFSLHGKTRRPTPEMLQHINLLIYDLQDIGSRSYTYINTLFLAMEEAAKLQIPVVVLDRPNPINGLTIDGPMLEEKWRSFVGYVNVPYCYGMTVGELARYFNAEYNIGCNLHVVPMKGWNRSMSFADTGLIWIPPSPNIPESSSALFYPTTGLLGELGIVNIGIGYTLPFKVVGAPWIDAERFCKSLNDQHFPGVHFKPFHYRPFYGKYANEECQGTMIIVTNPQIFLPVTTQYMITGVLKALYPKEFKSYLEGSNTKVKMFNQVNGSDAVLRIMREIPHIIWPLKTYHAKEREQFKAKRKKYLYAGYDLAL